MKRTSYDSSTRQYTFHDSTTGVQYISAPGERYGTLLPAATANYVKPKLGPGRKQTRTLFLYARIAISISHARSVQAYDRPVLFADDSAQVTRSASRTPSRSHKSAPDSPTTGRRHGHRHTRSATFADFLPASLIDSAPSSSPKEASPPPPPPPPKSAPASEKSHFDLLPHVVTHEKIESVSRHYPGDKGGARDALRSTARVFGRSLTTVRGHRSHRQRIDDGYVLV